MSSKFLLILNLEFKIDYFCHNKIICSKILNFILSAPLNNKKPAQKFLVAKLKGDFGAFSANKQYTFTLFTLAGWVAH